MSSSTPRRAALVGATGLVGAFCLRRLLADDSYDRVLTLGRRAAPLSQPKLESAIVDFDHPEHMRTIQAEDVFCALGTTLARAGSREAFRRVDYLAVLAVADLAIQGGARQFVVVSSVGADAASRNFYLSVKGEIEAAVAKRGFDAVHVLRPGVLLGSRAEARPAERVARAVIPLVNPLLIGGLRRYRGIGADVVGSAMVGAALENVRGRRVLFYDDMIRLARQPAV